MKFFTKNVTSTKITLLAACMALLFIFAGCKKGNQTPQLSITTVASGLPGIMGIDVDHHGNIWVSEGGTDNPSKDPKANTHKDDGKVVVITPNGKQYDAIINLESYMNVHSGELQGTVHILLDGNMLYVLSGDHLYRANISHFTPGDKPMDARKIPSEDIASVISSIPTPNNPENDSHPYNLTKGPDGDLYITDAGANAIVHRMGPNHYSILAEIPPVKNPLFNPDGSGLGGPTVQPVPTSIKFDGRNFLVTTLTGFPFPAGQSIIYKVSMSGNVSIYQKGFTMLVDQAEGHFTNHVAVQYASSFSLASGYAPNSGALLWVNGSTSTLLAGGLNQPVSIKQVDSYTWYVTSLGDGSVLKISYY
ncbi:MAG: ScyD/ScyE family protein [Ginsengibacter sp.]